jgi:hypothetical protein
MDIKTYWNREDFAVRSDSPSVVCGLWDFPFKTLCDLFGRFCLAFDGCAKLPLS